MKERLRAVLRWLASLVFVTIGVLHFTNPGGFVPIVPPALPAPLVLVYLSGAAEIAGGVGLLVPCLRRAAGIGLLLLLVAVFPANIYMAVAEVSLPDTDIPQWALWVRLPFQFVFMAWVWFVMREPADER